MLWSALRPLRLSLVAGLLVSVASAPAIASSVPLTREDAGDGAEEQEDSAFRKFEKSIDEVFGKVIAAAGTVLFYDLSGPFRTAPEAPTAPAGAGDWDAWIATEAVDQKSPERLYVEAERQYRLDKRYDDLGTLGKDLVRPTPPAGFTHVAAVQGQLDHEAELGEFNARAVPFLVLWLLIGAVFMTVRMGFINVKAFRHAIRVTKGKYDNPADSGEVSHFQALCSALSATVGLGNIAGVAIAVGTGGPGAIFWLIFAGFCGMSLKFAECTLGQRYRDVDSTGKVSGGPMRYLFKGLEEKGLGGLGKLLALLFAVLCIGGSLGGGNTFQVVQSLGAVKGQLPILEDQPWIYGLVMAAAVAVVIIGGIRRIATTASRIVPAMCGIYVIASMYIIFANAGRVPEAFGRILSEAFTPEAGLGGAIGVMVIGIKRAVFSNEAGVGSAAIAHSAAKTDEPVREGIVALLEPFIDTIVVCTMTGLVIVMSGVLDDPASASDIASNQGAALTSKAFASVISWFPWVLCVAVVLFAYSTMISWSYYGERCWSNLFGTGSAMIYRVIFVVFTFLGSILTATNILDFSDMMILSMALPNLVGLYFMSKMVRGDLDSYMGKLGKGEFKTFD